MTQIVIDPVTRIEGHAKITVRLDDHGDVDDVRFHVTEFRGFEEFCRGRPVWEMPGLTARTCGICPVSHLLAGAKAADQILAVAIPPAADRQRRLANLAQIVQSHALSFFHLSAPDLLLGWDADPGVRNVFGLMDAEPELARRGIKLRQFGQQLVETVTGSRIHGAGVVPGGVAAPLERDHIAPLRERLPQALTDATDTLALFTRLRDRFADEAASFGTFPSLFLSHCADDGTWEHYDGGLRVVDADGGLVADRLDPTHYRDWIGEWAHADTYLKSPYWRDRASPDDPSAGIYRVGPLARLNVCDRFGTPAADGALEDFRAAAGRPATSSFAYHEARLVEIVACLERIGDLLDDPTLYEPFVRAEAGINRRRGVGASEAPRGTLFHDYTVDADGVVTGVNMVIATGHNNLAMNATVLQIARAYLDGPDVPEGALNRIEAGIRAYDPCLSCSTHALGEMPLLVRVVGPDGALLTEVRRD